MEIFRYSEKETRWLAARDPVLGKAIAKIGPLRREVIPDLFEALARSIVNQQISDKAARTIWGRLETRIGEVTPATVARLEPEDLHGCGMSLRKAGYLQCAACAASEGRLSAEEFAGLPDDEVIRRLTALPGVGVWTAEMLMIFSMQRPDVVSFGDAAIRRGIMRLYGLQTLGRTEFDVYRSRWSPHGSVASFYLWAVAHRKEW